MADGPRVHLLFKLQKSRIYGIHSPTSKILAILYVACPCIAVFRRCFSYRRQGVLFLLCLFFFNSLIGLKAKPPVQTLAAKVHLLCKVSATSGVSTWTSYNSSHLCTALKITASLPCRWLRVASPASRQWPGSSTTCPPTAQVRSSREGGMGSMVMVKFHRFSPVTWTSTTDTCQRIRYHSRDFIASGDISTASFQGALRPYERLEIAQLQIVEGIHKEQGLTSLCAGAPKALCLQKIRCSPRSGQGNKHLKVSSDGQEAKCGKTQGCQGYSGGRELKRTALMVSIPAVAILDALRQQPRPF